jgi:hypothetical protein
MEIKYTIENSFIHFDTKERMYRIKREFTSGGIDYIVCNYEELEMLGIQK